MQRVSRGQNKSSAARSPVGLPEVHESSGVASDNIAGGAPERAVEGAARRDWHRRV
jgi:hypothetical protein